ncbi:DUF924 domain-containing protein [Dolichospermum sp. LEGE 00240]|jgi:uncharacterized protein (DUF924 family)|uniref:DUF924 family protein n=1 Tax=Dolichospermum sp. LEGE 00240 TaxID=1828603 RepID=UPI00187EDC7A|nr:DUF924 family protein [Dolichospermum sp. LEGE 00240]MDM3844826.1 DUF924 domain-containing protein [Aphanizomenon gracile PMC638.10]MDM3850198.1 DUF924 domain-containing protein [Aphanizomenon gracile PMC627.10]MDM3856350.1 DUF924 domain-containing protein [Aphanizomenon gracile PMC649.10]MDM3859924.1 DUF924 domain-containing protein [Aphanizomenon gracile PMC644.10]MBE9247830.1 DUF924 domain-containing protein [Dolichospermum sp. LEGE 00240]
MSQATTILDFWFGHLNDPNYGKIQPFWFEKQPDFDAKVRDFFLEDYQKAVAGYLHDWMNSPETCLALILLLDQFPRNMFRDTPQAFATDWEALSLAQHATNKGYDRQLLAVQRWFIYLPFEHSENIGDQRKCIKLFQSLSHDPYSAKAIASAFQHKEIIARFGRFPHRNAILGRISTPEEEEFLASTV